MSKQNPYISIVMAYYNRLDQTIITLDTISKSKHKNFEVIIIDDGSEDEQDPCNIVGSYSFNIHIIKINKSQKTWKNPCIPYNIGFKQAKGDIIIIQNPEVAHVGDVIDYVSKHTREGNYLTMSVFCSPSFCHNTIFKNLVMFDNIDINEHFISKINYGSFGFNYDYYIKKNELTHLTRQEAIEHWNNYGIKNNLSCNTHNIYHPSSYTKWKGWYNHPIYNNRSLHFLTAIHRSDLDKVGGFDPKFKNGIWYDDNDFLHRVKKVCTITDFDNKVPFGVHLYHTNGSDDLMIRDNFDSLTRINRKIKNYNINNNIIHVNIDTLETNVPYQHIEYNIGINCEKI